MNSGHVPVEVLASYADGSLADGMCLIVAGHLTFCPRCRERLARLEALGGALLTEPAPGCCAKPDLGKILTRLDTAEAPGAPPLVAEIPRRATGCVAFDHLPRCLRERLGSALTTPGWQPAAPGLSTVEVPIEGPGTLRLFRCDAGVTLPQHEHRGPSTALILRGTLREDGRAFGRGDLIISATGDRHAPVIDDSGPCVVLLLDEAEPLDITPRAPSSPE